MYTDVENQEEGKELIIDGHKIILGKVLGFGTSGEARQCTLDGVCCVVKITKKKNGLYNTLEPMIMNVIINFSINTARLVLDANDKVYIFQDEAVEDLAKWRTRNSYDREMTNKVILCLIEAICALHYNNIIHGDLKLNQLLLFPNGQVKLTDFSFSVWDNPKKEKYYKVVCTDTHRPLEVWNEENWNKSTDIWALGCTIFELMYGYSLFPIQDDGYKQYDNTLIKKMYTLAINNWLDYSTQKRKRKTSIKYKKPLIPLNIELKQDIGNRLIMACLQKDRPDIFTIRSMLDNFPNRITLLVNPEYISPVKNHSNPEKIKNFSNDKNLIVLSDYILQHIKYPEIDENIFISAAVYYSSQQLNEKINPICTELDYERVMKAYQKIHDRIGYYPLPIYSSNFIHR